MPVVEWDEQAVVTEWENQSPVEPIVVGGGIAAKREELRSRGGLSREELFDKHYWNGGQKVGGYAHGRFGETYMDFACHWHTVNHITSRRPESVLELGAARGYIGKKLQDAGVKWAGLEISKHCHMTRCCDPIAVWDLCKTPWGPAVCPDKKFDLCFSVAVLEHVPEEFLPAVIREMARTCRRGLHGVDFGHGDDGFDKTHCTLRPREFWLQEFAHHAPGWPVEILDKEELERGVLPQEVLMGDGKVKLEIGSFTTMTPFGWINIDIHDLAAFAEPNNYRYVRHDVRQGLPFPTGSVDCIHSNHFLEHLSYKDGLNHLRECRRVLKPQTGALRIAVPDTEMLLRSYFSSGGHVGLFPKNTGGDAHSTVKLDEFVEISDGVEQDPTAAAKLWELLFSGHQAAYDAETMLHFLKEAGFEARVSELHSVASDFVGHAGLQQIIRETNDTHPCLSLYVDAIPAVG